MTGPVVTLELPGLTTARAASLAAEWDDNGLWADVRWLANRFWAATDGDDRIVCWHHLVLAVGNFKRQPGRRLRPACLQRLERTHGGDTADSFVTQDGDVVHRHRRNTWEQLQDAMPGAGVATTTTLLSALWPNDHFVFDWRVRAAANGLRIADGCDPCPSVAVARAGGQLTPIDFDDYMIVRDWMRTAGCPVVTVERALYILSQKVEPVAGRNWDDYSAAVADKLADVPVKIAG